MDERRIHGRYYTPACVARFIVARCLEASGGIAGRILDPACGDGAFLFAALRLIDNPERQLFGVDNDRQAVSELRERIRIECHTRMQDGAGWCEGNFQCGDALIGAGLREGAADDGINWTTAFPEAAAAGGFDLVIGNPPYRRELNARREFERIARSPLGRRWREPRMDLWYYFLHRGLDLLRLGGRLSFIVNSYWTGSSGAGKLIERLRTETTLEEIVLLGTATVFPGVAGRHMIFRLRKERVGEACRVIDLTNASGGRPVKALEDVEAAFAEILAGTRAGVRSVAQRDLYETGRLLLPNAHEIVRPRPIGTRPLGALYDVRQGIAENPAVVTARQSRQSGGTFRAGEGVFVLTDAEVAAMGFSNRERRLLRPQFRPRDVGRYALDDAGMRQLIYATRATVPDIAAFPGLRRHLERFRPILDARRETRNGHNAWWQLHWPREERLFLAPRILCAQMGHAPRFVYVERPAFVNFSVNVIVARADSPLPLPALTGILNSPVARMWFERQAKRRGAHLEINVGTLARFPLPRIDDATAAELNALVLERQSGRPENAPMRERRIEEIARLVLRGRLL